MAKKKESVRLREKKLSNGSSSLYLDIYVDGKRTYEFLKLYLIPEETQDDVKLNSETYEEASRIRSNREVEIIKDRVAAGVSDGASSLSFFDYALHFASRSTISKARSKTINSVVSHMKKYAGTEHLRFSDIDRHWVMGFKNFLEKNPFKHNTRHQYMTVLRSMLRSAKADELLDELPFEAEDPIPVKETLPEFLTIEEVKTMLQASCENEEVKRAFLFSCLTGITFKDIKRVTWGQVQKFGNYMRISLPTFGPDYEVQYIKVTNEAVPFLGERGEDADLVFGALPDNKTVNAHLKKWVKQAGINKQLTFHVARHTFATMLLSLNVNPLTVQKLLGNRSLYSTQKYAAALRAEEGDYVDEIPSILNSSSEE